MRRFLALSPFPSSWPPAVGAEAEAGRQAERRRPAATRCRRRPARPPPRLRATRPVPIWTRDHGTVKIEAVKVYQRETELRTAGGLAVRDITDEVNEAVQESGVTEGIACIYSPHTTCCVRVNEFETGFIEDFSELLRRLVPSETYYAHDDWDKRTENICPEDMDFGNGHSHCMAMLLGTAGESVPVREGELCLGTWQRVLFIELDRERDRRWLVQVVGN
jgi:secondary thiamine-phosphate synthase enzyme